MAQLKIMIGGVTADNPEAEESPVQISYNLEDEQNSQLKSSAMAFDIEFPATVANDQLFNTFRIPGVIDLTADGYFRKSRPAIIKVDDYLITQGRAILQGGSSGTQHPESYTVNVYGDNGDWITEMQDLTLYDCLPTVTHLFTVQQVEESWFYDGSNAAQTHVYAPVRYTQPFDDQDMNISITQIRPSLFLYWMINRGFAKFGYQIQSTFMDSVYFRRLVMPWVWGNFMGINSKLADLLQFKATGPKDAVATIYRFSFSQNGSNSGGGGDIVRPGQGQLEANFTLRNVSAPAGFDNFGVYSFNDTTGEWKWTYKETGGKFGKITAYFGLKTFGHVSASFGSTADFNLDIYKNGANIQTIQLYHVASGASTDTDGSDGTPKQFNFSVTGLNVGDTVSIKIRYGYFKSTTGQVDLSMNAYFPGATAADTWNTQWQLFRISIEPGSIVNWQNFEQFKNYKFLDLLRGTLDAFDLIPATDPATKIVKFEPAHPYSIGGTSFTGYFKTDRLQWTDKLDVSQKAEVINFNDRERDYVFQMKGDASDGGVNILDKRFNVNSSAAKYRFSSRFKEGVETFENRFFSPVVHYKMTQWQNLVAAGGGSSFGIVPQIVAIITENISNTSSNEDEQIFEPKLCYYEGFLDNQAGTNKRGIFQFNGHVYPNYPYMFAVDYFAGGENKMVLTYNDQNINGVVAPGLMRRFFLPRLAIMDNGIRYKPFMILNNNDVRNWEHRERIIIGNSLYLLTNIDRYDPITKISTQCTFWKWVPVEQKNADAVFPSNASTLGTITPVPAPDLAYHQLFILSTDLP